MPFTKLLLPLVAGVVFSQSAYAVFGGHEVKSGDPLARGIVAIVMPDAPPCSGSLVARDLVLTAAHCVHGQKWEIVFGRSISDPAARALPVVDYAIHPKYTTVESSAGFNDLAILRFSGDLPDGYEAMPLARDRVRLRNGMPVLLAGYGVNDVAARTGAGVLRQTVAHVLDLRFSDAEMSVDQRHGTGACFGDSGGPALIETPQGYQIVGVTHGGPACDDYGIYTNVLNYLDWMDEVVARLDLRNLLRDVDVLKLTKALDF